MTSHIDSAVAVISTTGSALLGSQVAQSASSILADATAVPTPDWMQWLIGPAGALVGLVVALRWMAGRLNKADERLQAREDERDEDRKRLIEVLLDSTTTAKNTQEFINQTRQAIERMASAVQSCPSRKHLA